MEMFDVRRSDGVERRSFKLTVEGETVPGVLWTPEAPQGPRPLILMGHGGSQHKKTAGIVARAEAYARRHGWATLAIDAPGHGDRITREEAEAYQRDVGARVRGETTTAWSEEDLKRMNDRHLKAVPEWNAALSAVQALEFIGDGGPVGYWGVSMGTGIGVPFVAQQPKITAAVFGLLGLRTGFAGLEEAARRIDIPIEFVFQWEDAVAPREAGLDLFNAFGSAEKTLHVNPGGHMGIPNFETDSWERFFVRHLVDRSPTSIAQAA